MSEETQATAGSDRRREDQEQADPVDGPSSVRVRSAVRSLARSKQPSLEEFSYSLVLLDQRKDDHGVPRLHDGVTVCDSHPIQADYSADGNTLGDVHIPEGCVRYWTAHSGDNFHDFCLTVAEVNKALDVGGTGVAKDVVCCDLPRRDGHVEAELTVDLDVGVAIDDAADTRRAETLCEQRAHHVVLIIFGDGEVQVRATNLFLLQLLEVCPISMNDIHLGEITRELLGLGCKSGSMMVTSTSTRASWRERCSPMTFPP